MSSILNALKKLENDKASCKQVPLGIDSRILQESSPYKLSRTGMVLIAITLFICGGGAMYFYMKHNAIIHTALPQTPSSYKESASQLLAPRITTPVLKNRTEQKISPAHVSKPTPVIGTQIRLSNNHDNVSQKSSHSSHPEQKLESVRASAEPKSVPTAPHTTAIRPIFTVSGIAFQEGGNENMAVINGITVSNGTMLEGVKVEDIQRDRVRFSQGNEIFEIFLNKSTR
jgi:hypothetical protein